MPSIIKFNGEKVFKAVLLDVDGTLLDFNESAKEAMVRAFNVVGVKYSEKVFITFHTVNDRLWQRIEKGEITRAELHKIRWKTIYEELGVKADYDLTERLFLAGLNEIAVPVKDALETVKYLSKKYKVYTASNAPYTQQVNRLTTSGILPYITKILNFETLGIHKPQKEFFDKCAEAVLPANKSQTVIIGDSLSADIKGGRDIGITTVWFNENGKKIAEDRIFDYEINSLKDIKNIL